MAEYKSLTEKITLKENFTNLKRLVKGLHNMDKFYFPSNFSLHLVTVVSRYIGLYLSAYVLDALMAQEAFGVIFRNVAIVLVHGLREQAEYRQQAGAVRQVLQSAGTENAGYGLLQAVGEGMQGIKGEDPE